MLATYVVDILAADPPGGNIFDPVVTPPPFAEKYSLLLGIGLFFAAFALTGLAIFFGVKFAQSFAEGHGGQGQKAGIAACAVGAIMAASAGTWVTWFIR